MKNVHFASLENSLNLNKENKNICVLNHTNYRLVKTKRNI